MKCNPINRIKCEQIVNQGWSSIHLLKDEYGEIMKRGGPQTEREEKIQKIFADMAFLHLTFSEEDEKMLLEEDD